MARYLAFKCLGCGNVTVKRNPEPPTGPLADDWAYEVPDEDSAENRQRRRELLKKKYDQDKQEEEPDGEK